MIVKINAAANIQIEVEGRDAKAIIEECSELLEVLSVEACPCGQNKGYVPRHRRVTAKSGDRVGETFNYYELVCRSCQKVFPLSITKGDEKMYPKGPWQSRQTSSRGSDQESYPTSEYQDSF